MEFLRVCARQDRPKMVHLFGCIAILAVSPYMIHALALLLPDLPLQPNDDGGMGYQSPSCSGVAGLALNANDCDCIPDMTVVANSSIITQNSSAADALPPNPFHCHVRQYDAGFTIHKVPGRQAVKFTNWRVVAFLRLLRKSLKERMTESQAVFETLVPDRKFEFSDLGMMWNLYQDDTTTIGAPALTYGMVTIIFSGFAVIVGAYQGWDIRAYNFELREIDPNTRQPAYPWPVGIGGFGKANATLDRLAE